MNLPLKVVFMCRGSHRCPHIFISKPELALLNQRRNLPLKHTDPQLWLGLPFPPNFKPPKTSFFGLTQSFSWQQNLLSSAKMNWSLREKDITFLWACRHTDVTRMCFPTKLAAYTEHHFSASSIGSRNQHHLMQWRVENLPLTVHKSDLSHFPNGLVWTEKSFVLVRSYYQVWLYFPIDTGRSTYSGKVNHCWQVVGQPTISLPFQSGIVWTIPDWIGQLIQLRPGKPNRKCYCSM